MDSFEAPSFLGDAGVRKLCQRTATRIAACTTLQLFLPRGGTWVKGFTPCTFHFVVETKYDSKLVTRSEQEKWACC